MRKTQRNDLIRMGWKYERLLDGGERWTWENTTGYADVVIGLDGRLWVSSNKPERLLEYFSIVPVPGYRVTAHALEEAR